MSKFFDMAKYLHTTRKSALQAFSEGNYAKFIASIEQLKQCFDDPYVDKTAMLHFKEVMMQVNPGFPNIVPTSDKYVLKRVSLSEEAFNMFNKRLQVEAEPRI